MSSRVVVHGEAQERKGLRFAASLAVDRGLHGRPAVSLKAEVVSWYMASVRMWRFEEKGAARVRVRAVFGRMVATRRHPPWVTEEAIKARQPRHLLEDNPASG